MTVIVSPPMRTAETTPPTTVVDGSAPPLTVRTLPEIPVIVRVPVTPEMTIVWPTLNALATVP